MHKNLLENKVCIITGASRGIGRAVAELFSEEGGSIVLVGRNIRLLEIIQESIKRKSRNCLLIEGDVTDEAFAMHVSALAMETFDAIDVLVNNAGVTMREPFSSMTYKQWDLILKTNLYGTMCFCKAVLGYMKKGSCIVNVSSAAAKTPNLSHSHAYGASKAGILALTKSLALAYAPSGIRVNAVCPGPVETDMISDWTRDYREKKIHNIPLGRLGSPSEIAQVILFLASDLSSFICGESINVNGGTLME
jgi:3-oxoacyl-[acyl-carrier protein] reductase